LRVLSRQDWRRVAPDILGQPGRAAPNRGGDVGHPALFQPSAAQLEVPLDLADEMCYTGGNDVTECANDDEDPLCLPRENTDTIVKSLGMTGFFAI